MDRVQAVSIKLPAWWPDQPEVWFARVEAMFRQKGITTDATRFDHVLAVLDNETAIRVLDIIRAPPPGTSYEAVKARLIGSLSHTEFERGCKLIIGIELGEDKPSALMDRMLALYGQGSPDFLFRTLFLLKLPETVREHLHADDSADLHVLAKKG